MSDNIIEDISTHRTCPEQKATAVSTMVAATNEDGGEIDSSIISPREAMLTAVKAHAASIRRTLWLREYKRQHGRSAPMVGGSRPCKKLRNRNCLSPVIDGHIYSPQYWRVWRSRTRRRARAVQDTDGHRLRQNRRVNSTTQSGITLSTAAGRHETTQSPAMSHSAGMAPSSIPCSPTSSFAGGRTAAKIFALPDTFDPLREHHDTIVRPPFDRSPSVAARRDATCNGVRLSPNDPRPKIGNRECGADGRYDISRADRLVMPHAPSYSFRGGKSSGVESAIQGISKETPGAIYRPITRSRVPTTRLYLADRFRATNPNTLGTPGPGSYTPVEERMRRPVPQAVSWNGPETFMDSEWCKSPYSPIVRPWQGFGYGCSLKEHIDYGACLDGRCCARHSVEQKNALRVVQLLGQVGLGDHANTHSSDGNGRIRRQASSRTLLQSDRDQRFKCCQMKRHGGEAVHSPRGHSDGSRSSSRPGNTGSASISRSPVNTLGGKRLVRKRVPLHFASERGELPLVDRLCSQGDYRNAIDERGQTPLHVAAEKGKTRVVERLLRQDEKTEVGKMAGLSATELPQRGGADVNVQDDKGRTPLYLGCLRGHERVVRALLKAGADPDLVDFRGKSPQEVAEQQKTYQLLQFKADISLVKTNIAAIEERKRLVQQLTREVDQARACDELKKLRREEQRLKAAGEALEEKRAIYAAANESSRQKYSLG